MFMPRKTKNVQEKHTANRIATPPPPSPPPLPQPHPPNVTNIFSSSLSNIYTNMLSGIGLGIGSSLGREIVHRNLSSTEPEKKPNDTLLFTTNTHLGDRNPCHKEYKDYEEAVSHYLHYNDFSVEEYHKKYMKCLENNYGDQSKKINLLHH